MLRLIIFLRSSLLLSNHYLWKFCNVIRLEQWCFSLILKYLHVSIVFSYFKGDTQIDWHEILTDADFKQNNICQQKLFPPMVVKFIFTLGLTLLL